jgi:hypothetical protein
MIFLHHIFFKKFQLFFIPIFIYETEKGRGIREDFSAGTSNSTFFCSHHYNYFLPNFFRVNFYQKHKGAPISAPKNLSSLKIKN